jgi:hypothetical protein
MISGRCGSAEGDSGARTYEALCSICRSRGSILDLVSTYEMTPVDRILLESSSACPRLLNQEAIPRWIDMHGSRILYGEPGLRLRPDEEVDSEDDTLKNLNVHRSSTIDRGFGIRMVLSVSRELSRLSHEFTVLSMNPVKLAGDEVVDWRDIQRVNPPTYNHAHLMFSRVSMRCAVGEIFHL